MSAGDKIGKAIVVTPERLIVKELADSFQKEMLKENIDLEHLLRDLREGSHDQIRSCIKKRRSL